MATLPINALSELPPDPPIQVTQHVQKPEEFVVITSQVKCFICFMSKNQICLINWNSFSNVQFN